LQHRHRILEAACRAGGDKLGTERISMRVYASRGRRSTSRSPPARPRDVLHHATRCATSATTAKSWRDEQDAGVAALAQLLIELEDLRLRGDRRARWSASSAISSAGSSTRGGRDHDAWRCPPDN